MKFWRQDDSLSRFEQVGRRVLPGILRDLLRPLRARAPYSWQMGGAFRSTARLLRQSQRWDRERLRAYQLQKMREIISHAAENVPACRRRFAERGVRSDGISAPEDIRRFPFMTKEDFREDAESFVAQNIPRERLQRVTSGGTTGTPTGFYHLSGYNDQIADAFRWAMWRRIGYSPGIPALDLTASFSGGTIYDSRKNSLYVPVSCLGERSFAPYRDEIVSFRPQFILGFPSSVTLLAELVKERFLPDLGIQGVITSSEVMHEPQRRYISEVFGCRILDWYGLAEYAGFASGCEHSDEYHFFPECGYLELLGEDGLPVEEEGQTGEIVLTGFYSWAMPLIRYRTGDKAVLGGNGCAMCGRNYPLAKRILGRVQEFLLGRSGRRIPASALNVHSGIFDAVRSYQFHQDNPGRVILDVVRRPSYADTDTESIRRAMLERMGDDIELEIRFVSDIPRTSRGKHTFIVQKVPMPTLGDRAPQEDQGS